MGTGRWIATICGLLGCALLVAAPATAQAPDGVLPQLPSVSLPSELAVVLRDYEREWSEEDAEGLAALFTEDGFVGNRGGWIRGREGIRREYVRAAGPLRLRALNRRRPRQPQHAARGRLTGTDSISGPPNPFRPAPRS